MRKVIFWVLFIPLSAVMIVFGIIAWFTDLISTKYSEALSVYEDWTFGYTKAGWKRIEGGGAWTQDWRDDE